MPIMEVNVADELFKRTPGKSRFIYTRMTFNEDDVRRLARAADDLLPMMTARRNLTLAPFASLLKENKDG